MVQKQNHPSLLRNSYRRYSVKKSVPKNFVTFTGKCLCSSHFIIKASNFTNKRLQLRCFRVIIAKFLRTSIFDNICESVPPPPPALFFFFCNHLFFCNNFQELQTVFFEGGPITNNAPSTYVYPNTIKTFLTPNHLLIKDNFCILLTQHQL